MRIIIETDPGVKPQIQMGTQGTENLESFQGAPAVSANAIDAGPPKVGSLQQTSTSQTMESTIPQSDTSSGGSAPKDLVV